MSFVAGWILSLRNEGGVIVVENQNITSKLLGKLRTKE
jgi:hypothetical protein